jgi:hypothetical protein
MRGRRGDGGWVREDKFDLVCLGRAGGDLPTETSISGSNMLAANPYPCFVLLEICKFLRLGDAVLHRFSSARRRMARHECSCIYLLVHERILVKCNKL